MSAFSNSTFKGGVAHHAFDIKNYYPALTKRGSCCQINLLIEKKSPQLCCDWVKTI